MSGQNKGKKKRAPKRLRKPVTLTLSDTARQMGQILADFKGITFARLVEMLLRDELRKAGKLPPE